MNKLLKTMLIVTVAFFITTGLVIGTVHARNEAFLKEVETSWLYAENGKIPKGAVIAGHEKNKNIKLYLARGKYKGGVYVGKVRPKFKSVHIPYEGKEIMRQVKQYEVYAGRGRWVKASNGKIPDGAIIAGKDNKGNPLYAARAYYKGGLHPGMIGKGCKGALIPAWRKENEVKEYEVLVAERKCAVIFIHGMGDEAGTWGGLIGELSKNFTDRYRVFKFQYPWEDSIKKNGELLKKKIQEYNKIHKRMEIEHLIIVAHSMGGLVSRSYIVNSKGKFERLVTLGTPHLGTPPAVFTELGRIYPVIDQMKAGPRDLDPFSGFIKNLNKKDNRKNYDRYVLFAGKAAQKTGPGNIPMPGFKHPYDAKVIALWTILGGPALWDNDALVHVESAFIFPNIPEKDKKKNPGVEARILTEIEHFKLNQPYPYGKNKGLNIVIKYLNNNFRFDNRWFGERKMGLLGKNELWTRDYYCNPFLCQQSDLIRELYHHLTHIQKMTNEALKRLQQGASTMTREVGKFLSSSLYHAKKIPSRIEIKGVGVDIDIGPVKDLKKKISRAINFFKNVQNKVKKNMKKFYPLNKVLATFEKAHKAAWNVMDKVPTKKCVTIGKKFCASVPHANDVKENLKKAGDHVFSYRFSYDQWKFRKQDEIKSKKEIEQKKKDKEYKQADKVVKDYKDIAKKLKIPYGQKI